MTHCRKLTNTVEQNRRHYDGTAVSTGGDPGERLRIRPSDERRTLWLVEADLNVFLGALVVVGVAAATIALMLVVRSRLLSSCPRPFLRS